MSELVRASDGAAIATLDDAERFLEKLREDKDVDAIRDVMAQSAGLQEAMRARQAGKEAFDFYGAVKIMAERAAGQTLRGKGRPRQNEENGYSGSHFGVSSSTAKKWKQLAAIPADELRAHIEALKSRDDEGVTTKAVLSRVKIQTRRDDVAAQRRTYSVPDNVDVRFGEFETVLSDVADGSVDLVLTDPPYAADAVDLYGRLAEWSARKLKPGGSVIAYCGHATTPDVLDQMRQHLRYWWLISVEHATAQRLPGKFVMAEWKPAVWFVNGSRANQRLVGDRLRHTKGADQSEHRWAQDGAQLVPLLEQLTDPGDLVVDPFAGTGAFGTVAVGMGREFVGADLGTATF